MGLRAVCGWADRFVQLPYEKVCDCTMFIMYNLQLIHHVRSLASCRGVNSTPCCQTPRPISGRVIHMSHDLSIFNDIFPFCFVTHLMISTLAALVLDISPLDNIHDIYAHNILRTFSWQLMTPSQDSLAATESMIKICTCNLAIGLFAFARRHKS